jgi:20S proteasome subunit beta 4
MYVSLSTMDKWWYEGIDKRGGIDVLRKCIDETHKRQYLACLLTNDVF